MTRISHCRVCDSVQLEEILDLGVQALTGIFPAPNDPPVAQTPLRLFWCAECTLVQIGDDYDLGMLYGDNYGYRSGLNASMVRHLARKARSLKRYLPEEGATILDIGANDGTFLGLFEPKSNRRIGVDPSAKKFRNFYPEDIEVHEAFFGLEFIEREDRDIKADLITSISMFYDLPDPSSFVAAVSRCLSETGVWHLEQSYLPLMLETNSFDTVCHEHVEYYSLRVIEALLQKNSLEIIHLELNRVNGGSIALTAAPVGIRPVETSEMLVWLRRSEEALQLDNQEVYSDFAKRASVVILQLRHLIDSIKEAGKTVSGYGASTKGNVTLQCAGLGPEEISVIYEVNEDKFGKTTPGTKIPIVSEARLIEDSPDYLLVLPWHFREHVIEKCRAYLEQGGHLIFPLPHVDVVGG